MPMRRGFYYQIVIIDGWGVWADSVDADFVEVDVMSVNKEMILRYGSLVVALLW